MDIQQVIDDAGGDLDGAVRFDGMDAALIGHAKVYREGAFQRVLVYSHDGLVKACMGMGMSSSDAEEYVDYNIVNLWAGKRTPLIIHEWASKNS